MTLVPFELKFFFVENEHGLEEWKEKNLMQPAFFRLPYTTEIVGG